MRKQQLLKDFPENFVSSLRDLHNNQKKSFKVSYNKLRRSQTQTLSIACLFTSSGAKTLKWSEPFQSAILLPCSTHSSEKLVRMRGHTIVSRRKQLEHIPHPLRQQLLRQVLEGREARGYQTATWR
eukprot:765457-Hanusia_phi.AAC.3